MSELAAAAPTRHLAYADALEAIYDGFFQRDGADVVMPVVQSYGCVIATLRAGTTRAADGTDEVLADYLDEMAVEFSEPHSSLDPSTLREIARLMRSGELLSPTINAEAARWHRDEQRALLAQLGTGLIGHDRFECWQAKMETHRLSAAYFDGYAGAGYRFAV